MTQSITVDLDEKMRPCKFLEYVAYSRSILETVRPAITFEHNSVSITDTRRGHHIKLESDCPESFVIMIQLFLGSDRRREAYNFRRQLEGKFRSYLFDAKITRNGSYVNERNQMLEGIWKTIFNLSLEEFEQKYELFQRGKYNGGTNSSLAVGKN